MMKAKIKCLERGDDFWFFCNDAKELVKRTVHVVDPIRMEVLFKVYTSINAQSLSIMFCFSVPFDFNKLN